MYDVSAFRLVGSNLSLVLIAWIIWILAFAGFGVRPDPQVVGFGAGAAGDLSQPVGEGNAVVDTVRQRMIDFNRQGQAFAVFDDVLGWLAFAVTSAITLIAGFFGRQPSADDDNSSSVAGLPPGAVRVIAFLAALGAVLTGASSIASSEAQARYDQADQVMAMLVDARRDLVDTDDATVEQQILDELLLKSSR